tara:strand:- start:373 stop:687 length:315 start_codon:yes stop_codon:yes gene_type:complete
MRTDITTSEDRKKAIQATAFYQSGDWFTRDDLNRALGTKESILNTAIGQMVKADGLLESEYRRKAQTNTRIVWYRRRATRVNWLCKTWRMFNNEAITGEPEHAR